MGAAFHPFCSPASGLLAAVKRESQNKYILFTAGGGGGDPNLPRENMVLDGLYVWLKTYAIL